MPFPDVVIVPTYKRREFLTVCLEELSHAHGIEDKQIIVVEDYHDGDDVPDEKERRNWLYCPHCFKDLGIDQCRISYRVQRQHPYYGNSFNVLEALKFAYELGPERVYLVEDDVMVTEDFFYWHEAMQKQVPDCFATVASPINASLEYAINGPEVLDEKVKDPFAYHVSTHAYSSIGVCFSQRVLKMVVGRADESFYGRLGPGVEQDLEIKKLMRAVGEKTVWPYYPRAYHIGWYGYHRNTSLPLNGTLSEKCDQLRDIIHDQKRLSDFAKLQSVQAVPLGPMLSWWSGPQRFYELRKFR